MGLRYYIANEIFERFPDYCRGVVIAHGVRNGSSPPELLDRLRAAEGALSAQLGGENVATLPRIAAWREAYRALGVKPSEFRPSVEALIRRVAKNDPLPAINAMVDLGNLVSIQHLLPIGAHAIDILRGAEQDIALRLATGAETFEPFGSDAIEHPLPGEVIFVEGETVLTRRWTWRQAKRTLVTPETTAVEINVDGLPPVTPAEVGEICAQAAELVQRYCGGRVRYEILSREKPCIELGV
jgi:DNA/RNA-binding domain of Phe-tRNA-synthetase-like protein